MSLIWYLIIFVALCRLQSNVKRIAAATATVLLTTPAYSQSTFYDRNGHYAGSTQRQGNQTSAYDRNGYFAGSAIKNSDGTTSYYDRSGHFVGSRR